MAGAHHSFSEKEMLGKKVILTFQEQRITHDLNGVRYCLVTLSHSPCLTQDIDYRTRVTKVCCFTDL